MSDLISAAELAARSDEPGLRLLDVRWELGNSHTHDDYLSGHLPGAIFVDLDAELADPPAPALGRHPLPSAERFGAAVRRWGLHQGDTVVVYDGVGGVVATRAWWLLRDAGFEDVRLLDGGIAAWQRAGGALETGEAAAPGDGDFAVEFGHLPRLSLEEVASFAREHTLFDIRTPDRYRGEHEPVDPRAGHVPGAVSAPTGANLNDQGLFRSPAELRARFEALGAAPDAPVAAYCGSGVTATHTVFALTQAGFSPALFPGSWSQWSNHPELPVATGDRP